MPEIPIMYILIFTITFSIVLGVILQPLIGTLHGIHPLRKVFLVGYYVLFAAATGLIVSYGVFSYANLWG